MQNAVIDHDIVKRLVNGWPKRAGVRCYTNYMPDNVNLYDENLPDYPVEMLPFQTHPKFINTTPEQQQEILTWGWLVYNERVITAEEHVANPAFAMIMQGVFPGAEEYHIKQALQQCLIDEHFHSLLHITAIQETKKLRSVNINLAPLHSIIYRRFLEAQGEVSEKWQRDLLTLIWTVVSEVSINAYLELLSKNNHIQPMHKTVAWLHNRDEYAHSKIVVEISKIIYEKLTPHQKRFFVNALPKALDAFVAHDFSAWSVILKQAGVSGYAEIIKDCEESSDNFLLDRDFSGLKKLATELDIIHQLDFEFK